MHITKTAIEANEPLFRDGEEGSGRDVSPEAPPQPKLQMYAEQRKPTPRQQDWSAHVNHPRETQNTTHQVVVPVKIKTSFSITQISNLSDNNWVNW